MASEHRNQPRRSASQPRGHARLTLGVVLLAVCVASAGILALNHLLGLAVPGCGEGSPCAELAASAWGRLPVGDWPVAYLGLAYFLGLLVAWLVVGGRPDVWLRAVIRLGVAASVLFVVVMLVGRQVCEYCLATHAANIALWLMVETAGSRWKGAGRGGLLALVGVFVVATAVLGVVDSMRREQVRQVAEQKLEESVAEMVQRETPTPATQPADADQVVAEQAQVTDEQQPAPAARPFEGRYRLGPEKAAIRVVVFSDYQCKQCRRTETELLRIARQRDDMALSIKHYPMSADCNRRVTRSVHPNACWAARAAEAAGILRGNDGFWQMHEWLFSREGAFTREVLRQALRQFGYDIARFERTMTSAETLERVKADVEEGIALGVWYTPTIYINGVELRGWEAPHAIPRAIAALDAARPEPATAAADHPVPALDKLIGDWREGQRLQVPAAPDYRRTGAAEAAVRVVVFGDFRHPGTAEVDAVIRRLVQQRDDVSYEFCFFPFNKDCNPVVRKATKYPLACRAAALAEAAGRLGGPAAYWSLHQWLFAHVEDDLEQMWPRAAAASGLDPQALLALMETDELQAAVLADARRGQRLGARSVPTIYINGRKVPRWNLEKQSILPLIVEAAAAGR